MGECSSIRARDQEEKHFTFVVSSIHKTGFGNTIVVLLQVIMIENDILSISLKPYLSSQWSLLKGFVRGLFRISCQ